MQLLDAALRERESLMTELHDVPAYRKLMEVQKVIDVYRRLAGARHSDTMSHRRIGTTRAAAEAAVVAHLSATGQRATSGQLLDVVLKFGAEIPTGDTGVRYLASLLSTSPLFDNVRGWGYGLVEWGGETSAPSVREHDAGEDGIALS